MEILLRGLPHHCSIATIGCHSAGPCATEVSSNGSIDHLPVVTSMTLGAALTSLYVTEFAKTDLMGTNTEIHFLPVDESHTHALSRNTKHLRLDGQVSFFRRLYSNAVKPRGCISWPVWPLRGINKTAWGAKLILMAGLAYPVSCASLGHLLTAQHCHLCLSVCFSPSSASHPPPPPPHPL